MRQILINKYLDYINNYLTLGTFAEHNELSNEDAMAVLQMGKKYHEEYVHIMKLNIPVEMRK